MEKYEKKIVIAATVGTAILTSAFTMTQGPISFNSNVKVASINEKAEIATNKYKDVASKTETPVEVVSAKEKEKEIEDDNIEDQSNNKEAGVKQVIRKSNNKSSSGNIQVPPEKNNPADIPSQDESTQPQPPKENNPTDNPSQDESTQPQPPKENNQADNPSQDESTQPQPPEENNPADNPSQDESTQPQPPEEEVKPTPEENNPTDIPTQEDIQVPQGQ